MHSSRIKYIFPLGLFIALFLDGTITQAFAPEMFTPAVAIESRLLLLWLIMAVCYSQAEHILLWAGIAGFFFDLYYTGILGISVILLPLVVYLTQKTYQFFTGSFIVVLLIYLIDVTLLTLLFYLVNSLIGFTDAGLTTFIARTLGPTLAYNLAMFVILFIPLKSLFEKM